MSLTCQFEMNSRAISTPTRERERTCRYDVQAQVAAAMSPPLQGTRNQARTWSEKLQKRSGGRRLQEKAKQMATSPAFAGAREKELKQGAMWEAIPSSTCSVYPCLYPWDPEMVHSYPCPSLFLLRAKGLRPCPLMGPWKGTGHGLGLR